MPGRHLIIAAVLAVLLHCGVAFVRMPASQPYFPSEDKPLALSIISEHKRIPEISEVVAHETKKEKDRKVYDRKEAALEKSADVPVKEREKADASPRGVPARISDPSPPPQAGQDTGKRPGKIVTEPAIPCYKSNPPPQYPEIARRRGYEGEVLLSVMVAVDGTVVGLNVKESSGHSVLDRAAMKAVATWEFEPARRMGVPVPLPVDIPVRFVLRRP